MPLLLIFLSISLFSIHAKIIQLQIIHRHGARHVIHKHATDPRVENRSPTLYPAGVQQLKTLGSFCRSRYLDTSSSFHIEHTSPNSISEGDIISTTSNFERTHLSARAFLSTLYPEHHEQIPTLVFNGTETDWIIRGYALCPHLAQRFQDFVKEDDGYRKQKETHEAFVVRLARKLGYEDEDAKFENVFNVYDEYNILHHDYDIEKYKNIEKLSDSEMTQLKQVADWFEAHKFSFATHNVHVAGGLLTKIIGHARSIKQGSSYRIVHISAHYPTLLTLFASIRSRNEGSVTWPADQIPEFGAALIFEVHEEDDGELWLRMKWFRGGDGAVDPKAVAIDHADCTDAEKGCQLSSVERIVALDTFGQAKFCRDCRSTSGVCEFLRHDDRESSSSQVEQPEVCSLGTKVTSGAIGGAIGLVIGLMVWLSYLLCISKRKRMGMERGAMDQFDSSPYDGNVYA